MAKPIEHKDPVKAEPVKAKPAGIPHASHEPMPRNRIVGLQYVPATEMMTNEKNWRRHPQAQRDALTSVIDKVGIAGAVIAYKSERNGGALTLIDGHMRSDHLRGEIPVLVLDVNDEEADLLLFSYDRLGGAANEDIDALDALMADIRKSSIGEMDQMFRALDTERAKTGERDDKEKRAETEAAEYPIEPVFDEAYSYVVVFTKTEQEYRDLTTRLQLQKREVKGKPALSHVLTAKEFFEQWDNRS